MQRRLERSTSDRVITGVCGGIGQYLAINTTLVRVFFILATLFTAGVFVLVYIALILLMPFPGERAPIDSLIPGATTPSGPPPEPGAEPSMATPVAPSDPAAADRRRAAFGYALLALGLIFLAANFGAFRFIQWQYIWPLVFIGVGVLLLVQRTQR